MTVNAGGSPRRLDIADEAALRGIEYKTGYQYASEENLWEVSRDAILVKGGWSIEWVFQGTASQPLLEALKKAKIPYSFR